MGQPETCIFLVQLEIGSFPSLVTPCIFWKACFRGNVKCTGTEAEYGRC